MDQEIAVSLNVVLNRDLIKDIKEIQRELNRNYKEQRNYDTTPHLAIVTKFMIPELAHKYANLVTKELITKNAFNISFKRFKVPNAGTYIFLDLDEESKRSIIQINREVKKISKNFGFETPKGLPSKYSLDPHISIIKLEQENIGPAYLALKKIKTDLTHRSYLIEELEITKEVRKYNGYATFPKIAQIELAK